MPYKISVGEWVGTTEDGLVFSSFEENKVSWKTKNEIIKDIGATRLDIARRPKVKRVAQGKYFYTVKNCDTGRYEYGSDYEIVKLTPENIQYYQKMLDDTLESGDDLDEE